MSGVGYDVRRLRAHWAARLAAGPLPCSKCGGPVTADNFHVDHLVPRSKGGAPNDVNNTWPSHPRCNMRAGQALGQQSRRANTRADSDQRLLDL
ncbi:HNH endonuclease signature motif containing protein [Cellulosimicrobium funkei]|uniref:HNH endonuclease n=1 Tax=Cellulosimicrobium funkei TaxID=264251 RepID=UPI0009E60AAC